MSAGELGVIVCPSCGEQRWAGTGPCSSCTSAPEPSEADPGAGEREWSSKVCRLCGHFDHLHTEGPCSACASGKRNRSHVAEHGEHGHCLAFRPATQDAGDVEAEIVAVLDAHEWTWAKRDRTSNDGVLLGCSGCDWTHPPSGATGLGWRPHHLHLADLLAATADRVRRETTEAIATAIEADANSHTTGWTSTNHRAYAGHFARIAREAGTR